MLIKWHKPAPESSERILARLAQIREIAKDPSLRILGPEKFGISADGFLRLEIPLLKNAISLHQTASQKQRSDFARRLDALKEIPETLSRWRKVEFIHGDLSPRNLLFFNDTRWIAIDWTLDLRSFEGTPRFCALRQRRLAKEPVRFYADDHFSYTEILRWAKLRL